MNVLKYCNNNLLASFYDFSTLGDSQSYEEMRVLARGNFGLDVPDDGLPISGPGGAGDSLIWIIEDVEGELDLMREKRVYNSHFANPSLSILFHNLSMCLVRT